MPFQKICLLLSLLVFSVAITGCGPSDPRKAAIANVNKTNIQRVANLYKGFQMRYAAEGFRGPANLQELKEFASSMEAQRLSDMGIDPSNLDAIMVSERDGEPLDIRFDVAGGPRGSDAAVVFESKGVDGKKMVGFLNSRTEELDEAEANKLKDAK